MLPLLQTENTGIMRNISNLIVQPYINIAKILKIQIFFQKNRKF